MADSSVNNSSSSKVKKKFKASLILTAPWRLVKAVFKAIAAGVATIITFITQGPKGVQRAVEDGHEAEVKKKIQESKERNAEYVKERIKELIRQSPELSNIKDVNVCPTDIGRREVHYAIDMSLQNGLKYTFFCDKDFKLYDNPTAPDDLKKQVFELVSKTEFKSFIASQSKDELEKDEHGESQTPEAEKEPDSRPADSVSKDKGQEPQKKEAMMYFSRSKSVDGQDVYASISKSMAKKLMRKGVHIEEVPAALFEPKTQEKQTSAEEPSKEEKSPVSKPDDKVQETSHTEPQKNEVAAEKSPEEIAENKSSDTHVLTVEGPVNLMFDFKWWPSDAEKTVAVIECSDISDLLKGDRRLILDAITELRGKDAPQLTGDDFVNFAKYLSSESKGDDLSAYSYVLGNTVINVAPESLTSTHLSRNFVMSEEVDPASPKEVYESLCKEYQTLQDAARSITLAIDEHRIEVDKQSVTPELLSMLYKEISSSPEYYEILPMTEEVVMSSGLDLNTEIDGFGFANGIAVCETVDPDGVPCIAAYDLANDTKSVMIPIENENRSAAIQDALDSLHMFRDKNKEQEEELERD